MDLWLGSCSGHLQGWVPRHVCSNRAAEVLRHHTERRRNPGDATNATPQRSMTGSERCMRAHARGRASLPLTARRRSHTHATAVSPSHAATEVSVTNSKAILCLWMGLAALLWCCHRSSLRAQTLAFLAVEAVYIALHLKPLVPLVSGQQVDAAFLRTFTVAAYFASELALFWLLAYASPIRAVLPKAALGVHAAFHVLYTALAAFARKWCLQQNLSRLQTVERTSWLQAGWDRLLNILNAADAGLHALYLVLLAKQL